MRDTEMTTLANSVTATGICAGCIHASTCLYQSTARQPIWFCEMFENDTPLISHPKTDSEYSVLQIQPSQFTGLCANCDKRGTCTLPKPESGVWHCEEYV